MVFSTNQVTQFYVISAAKTAAKSIDGQFVQIPLADGAGNTVKSDLIPVGKILDLRVVDAANICVKKAVASATIPSPVAGQDYIVRVTVTRGLEGSGDKVTFTGSAHAGGSTTAAELATALAASLNATQAHKAKAYFTAAKTSTSDLTITLADPDWKLGTFPLQSTDLKDFVSIAPIVSAGDIVRDWASFSYTISSVSGSNGKILADLEYFALGEKGADDVHGFGAEIADIAKAVNPASTYHVGLVQYYRDGARDSVQKSERTLVIISTTKADVVDTIKSIGAAAGVAKYNNISDAGVASQIATS